jgi:hypothetical protein
MLQRPREGEFLQSRLREANLGALAPAKQAAMILKLRLHRPKHRQDALDTRAVQAEGREELLADVRGLGHVNGSPLTPRR